MIDLLQIPGTWRRPNPSSPGQDYDPFDASPRNVTLYSGGEADWQFRGKLGWSSSGHWKIVKGTHLSIVAICPDPMAVARGESACEFYYHLVRLEPDRMTVRRASSQASDEVWARVAPGRHF